MGFGARNKKEEPIFAEERFRFQVQHRIQTVMNALGVSQKDLAGRMDVSEPRVSQIFSDKANLTVRMLARVFWALDDECHLESRRLTELAREQAIRDGRCWKLVTNAEKSEVVDDQEAAFVAA